MDPGALTFGGDHGRSAWRGPVDDEGTPEARHRALELLQETAAASEARGYVTLQQRAKELLVQATAEP